MEEHQHNEPFKEEYWQDALGVLELEERKARRKKVVPLFFSIAALVLVVFAVRYYVTPTTIERAATDTIEGPHTNRLIEDQSTNDSHASTEQNVPQLDDASTSVRREYAENQETDNTSVEDQLEDEQSGLENQQPDEKLIADDNNVEEDEEQNEAPSSLDNEDEDSAHEENDNIEDGNEMLDPPNPEDTADDTQGGNPFESILNQGQPEQPSISSGQLGFGFANTAINPLAPSRIATADGKLFSLHFEDKHREFLRLPTMSTPITVFVGNAFAPGYGSRKASHWNPQAGIALEHRVENNLWFRVSVGGQQISQTFAAKSYLEEQASFGYEALETRISTDRLYLLDVPVGLVWDAFMRHSFIVGGGVEAIVRTENTLEKNKIDAFGTENIDSESSYGYLTGYNPIMYNLNIGYRYKFSKRNSLDIVASTGFHEVNQIGTSKNGRISIRYNFQIK